jgi:hypothetical protein
MSEVVKSKHFVCALVVVAVVVGFLIYNSKSSGCGCQSGGGQSEGYVSPALRSMEMQNKKEGLYQPKMKEKISYVKKPNEGFVPAPPSMMAQMSSMRSSPVSKSMTTLAPYNPTSPFINYEM